MDLLSRFALRSFYQTPNNPTGISHRLLCESCHLAERLANVHPRHCTTGPTRQPFSSLYDAGPTALFPAGVNFYWRSAEMGPVRSRTETSAMVLRTRSAEASFSAGNVWATATQRIRAALAAWTPLIASSITAHYAGAMPSFRAAARKM